jgi:hypothetical protein
MEGIMANKTRNYVISWAWKEDGNRGALEQSEVKATTVPRAISKLVAELNDEDGAGDGAEEIRASDILVVDCRTDGR